MSEKQNFKTSIGGQALIEGILMRGPEKQAIVVNAPGGYVIKEEPVKLPKDKYKFLGWPIIRGVANFISSMVTGVKATTFSAECLPEEMSEEPGKFEKWINEHVGGEKAEKMIIGLSVFLGIALAVVLFMLLPTIITGVLGKIIESRIALNLIEGAVRILIFLGYIWLATRLDDIKRVWMYHGAEHKTIFCYEAGLELTVENCRKQSRMHPRCGTSFLFIVMIVSILVFSVISWSNVWVRMGLRLVLLPLVVGISYELIKLAGKYDNLFTRIISAPGKAMQHLTTREPDDEMIEVAIEALKRVLPEVEGSDRW